MMKLSIEQEFALIEETRTSIFLIQEGLLALNLLSGANDFYHGPMQLLAQGFERLLKVVVCLEHLENYGKLPALKEISAYGHNLITLTDAVVDLAHRTGYSDSRPAAQMDTEFMANDKRARSLLSLLADFGAWGRYYSLDTFLDPSSSNPFRQDPVESFQAVENEILDLHPEWKTKVGQEFEGFYAVLRAELTTTLQRFARALCRFFTLGPLGDRGQRLLGNVKIFLFLRDEELDTVRPRWFEA